MEPDAVLVVRFRDGDEAAFELLVRRYEVPVRKLVYGYVRDTMAAEDIAQESFLQAYQRIDSLGKVEAFRSWLYRIAINRARDELRRRARKGELAGEEGEERVMQEPDPIALGDRLEARELGRSLFLAIAELPEKYRRPLILKEVEGMTYAEIGELLGWPMGTVQIRVHRARLRLRDELAHLRPDEEERS